MPKCLYLFIIFKRIKIVLKRIAAILLLSLLLFNAAGYYLLFAYEQVQARHMAIQEMPDSNFKIFKFLISPYAHIEDRDFEFTEGQFIVDGKTYNAVKKRIVNDSLQLYCLNNFRQDQLTAQYNDFVTESVFDGANSPLEKSPVKQMLKSFLKDYVSKNIYVLVVNLTAPKTTDEHLKIGVSDDRILTSSTLSVHAPPPNFA